MVVLAETQRTGILERLKHNPKYSVIISYAGKDAEQEAAQFAGLLQGAGWTVLGPYASENIRAPGLQIGVRDHHSLCPSAHLLVDVLVSVGLNVKLATAAGNLPSAFFDGCSLLFGPSRTSRRPGYDGENDLAVQM